MQPVNGSLYDADRGRGLGGSRGRGGDRGGSRGRGGGRGGSRGGGRGGRGGHAASRQTGLSLTGSDPLDSLDEFDRKLRSFLLDDVTPKKPEISETSCEWQHTRTGIILYGS